MSSYEDHVWCDVLDIDAAHISLGRPWLYDLDVTSPNRSNTYEFKFNGKKIVLKPAKPKSIVGSTKERTITEKNEKIPDYLVIRTHFSPQLPIDGSTPRSWNSRGLLFLPLGIPPIAIVEPSVP